MNTNMQLRFLIILITMIVLSAAAVFGEQVRRLSFDLWAEGAEVFFFDDSRALYDYAGSIDLDRVGSADGEGFPGVPEKDFLPWTRQRSVSGFAGTSDGLVIGINKGYPLRFNPAGEGERRFKRPSTKLITEYLKLSAGRTLATVYTEDESVFFHLYRDDLFEAAKTGVVSEALPGTYLLRYEAVGTLSAVNLNLADTGTEWEPVEIVNTSEGSLAAWKYSDEKKTRFRYIKHSESGEALKEIDEDYFRDGYPLISFNEGSFALRGFIRAVREGVLTESLTDAGDVFLTLSSADSAPYSDNYPAFFFDRDEGGFSLRKPPVLLPAASSGMLWYILSDNSIIRCSDNIAVCDLPSLPPGFKYKELWAGPEYLIVSWEETRFPYIGRSGMMTVRLSDILNY